MRLWLYCALCGISVIYPFGELRAQTYKDVSSAAGFFGENSSWAAAWADYNHDGHLDVITLGHVQQDTGSITQLWRNNGDGSFTDVTVQAGLNPHNGDCHGVVWGDFDNDGRPDLFIAKGGKKTEESGNLHELWRNNGDGTFTNIASLAGVAGVNQRGRGANGVDYNSDGQLDIFILGFARSDKDGGNSLYRNNGKLKFTDVAHDAGVEWQGLENRTAAWADFNGDGFTDVMVLSPYTLDPPPTPTAQSCFLFINQGNETYKEVTETAGITHTVPMCSTGAWGDYDNDGDLDLYITMSDNIPGLLYRNDGDGTFTDVTTASKLINADNARGVVWGDYDNDGDLDLYIVNTDNAKVPNRLFRNNGDGTFTDVTAEAGVKVQVAGGGVDASFVDYNRDGFLDLFVTNGANNLKGPYVLLANQSKQQDNHNHWLQVQLQGKTSNRDGIMTKAWVTTEQGRQFREYTGPQHYMAQDHTPLHFGVGAATAVEELELAWPNGEVQVVPNLGVDQVVTVVEGESIARGQPPVSGLGYDVWQTAAGEWHLRWYGQAGEPRHQFTGRLTTTDGTFTKVTPKQLESNDQVQWDATTITFTGYGQGGYDEVTFTTTGTQVQFELKQDGVVRPGAIRIGRQGVRPGTLPLTLPN